MNVGMSNELSDDNNFNENLSLRPEKTEIIVDNNIGNIYRNITRNIIIISDDKLELNALKFKSCIENKAGLLGWGGILVSVILTLVTANFHDFLGISNATILAIFYVVALGIVIKMFINIIKLIYGWYKNRNILGVEDFIKICRDYKP